MKYLRSFSEIGAGDIAIVGGKGANLGETTRAGLPVPPGFCVTAEAYRDFIAMTGVADEIKGLLLAIRPEDAADLEIQTERIRALVTGQAMPAVLAGEILEGYHHLEGELGARLPVAVRSSATAEDLPTASFAGQQDSYLNIRGDEDLLSRVKSCWASLWNARAVAYRINQRFDHAQVALAVVVQAMIQSEVSGILFTANPINGNRGEMVVNASWGLGEAIVSGHVTPDTLTIRKSDGAILSRVIANKDRAIVYGEQGGTVEIEIPAERREMPALPDGPLAALIALSLQVERHYAAPMDIEWAYAQGQFYILQARPITTLKSESRAVPPASKGEYNRTMFIEIFPDPLSPVFLSVLCPLFQTMLDFTFQTLGFKAPDGMEAVGIFYNQPYFYRNYIAAAFRELKPETREALIAQVTNPFRRHGHGLRGESSPRYLQMVFRLLRFMVSFPGQLPAILARYRSAVREIEALPTGSASDREIVDRLQRLVFGAASGLLNYDFLMIALIGITYQMLGTLQRYLGDDSEEHRVKLITGVTGNVTMETNKRLWDLAQVAKSSPVVSNILREYGERAARRDLEETSEGRAFLAELDRFLQEYGHREIRMDILYPTWGEDPTPVIAFIRGYLDVDEKASPHRQQARLVQEREELMGELRHRRRGVRGRVLWPVFGWMLRNTQVHTRERDTMHFELTRMFPSFRRLLLELGGRWTARGLIDQSADIFFLTLEEILEITSVPRAMQDEVRQRRAAFEENKQRPAPLIIRDGVEVYADPAAPAEAESGQLNGIAGSPGKATGAARVITSPEEFVKLQTGDILVAPLTNPVWTPLFAIAGGIITEVGGILSHGAIVAREYGIPAVMAVPGATKILREGQRVTVDGNRGTVYVESIVLHDRAGPAVSDSPSG